MVRRVLHASVLLASLSIGLASVRAQALEMDVVGGSLPGPLTFDCYPSFYPTEFVMVIPSTNPGPTQLNWFDPNDTRSLDVGIELLGSAFGGVWLLDPHVVIPSALGTAPAFQDLPIYFQAVTFSFAFTIVDRISNPVAVRLGNANSFRDRAVVSQEARAFSTVVQRPDRKWILMGGARGQLLAQVATATTEVFDPWTDSFSLGPNLSTPRSMHASTQLSDGRWLISGGVNAGNDPQAFCEIYDPAADTFTLVSSMGTPRMGHTATLLDDGRVLVTGGLQAVTVTPTQLSAIHDAVATTEIYDPVADTWTPGPNLLTPRAAHVAIKRPNGTVLLAGGISWDPNIIFGWVPAVRSSCDLFNPTTGTIVAGPSMSAAHSLVPAVDLGANKWLVAGGINGISIIPFNPGNPTAVADVYDAVANTWTTVGPLTTARANQQAWPLGNGQFLLAGGAANSILSPTPLATTEVFSLATNSFSPGPVMTSPRAGAAMFETPTGQVMLFGGSSTGNQIVPTTEWYFR